MSKERSNSFLGVESFFKQIPTFIIRVLKVRFLIKLRLRTIITFVSRLNQMYLHVTVDRRKFNNFLLVSTIHNFNYCFIRNQGIFFLYQSNWVAHQYLLCLTSIPNNCSIFQNTVNTVRKIKVLWRYWFYIQRIVLIFPEECPNVYNYEQT